MAANTQAYSGFGAIRDTTSEYNRTAFIVQALMAKQATTTLVLVVAVDGETVDVQPMVDQVTGGDDTVPHGVINNLPVWRVQGGNSAVIVKPAVGDIGVALFCSTDISSVKRTKAPGPPGSARRFDWADGIYLGGVLNAAPTQFVQLDDTGVTITAASGLPVTINAPGGLVVNAPTAEYSGSLTTGPGSTFNGKSFDTHTHGGVTTGGGTSGPPA